MFTQAYICKKLKWNLILKINLKLICFSTINKYFIHLYIFYILRKYYGCWDQENTIYDSEKVAVAWAKISINEWKF